MVTPSYMLAILDEFHAQGLDPRRCSLKVGIFGAEPWTNAMRGEIEQAFDMHAVDIYGLSEVIGPGVANECVETKDGLHVWEDHFYPEIVDPRDRRGAAGRRARRTRVHLADQGGDAGRALPHARPDAAFARHGAHRCGGMEKITGRSDDMMIVRGVNVFPTQIEELILDDARLAPHFLIELRRDGRLDEMTVRVEARSGSTDESRKLCDRDLAQRIKALIGVSAIVETVAPGAIERSVGKAKRISICGRSSRPPSTNVEPTRQGGVKSSFHTAWKADDPVSSLS